MITAMPRIAIAVNDFDVAITVFRDQMGMFVDDFSEALIYFINKKMFIRIKKDGDRIKQFKNSEILTRVKKVLSNYKKKNKNEALILCSEETILWIIGVRQSVDSYVQKNDKKVIEFSILKNPIQS